MNDASSVYVIMRNNNWGMATKRLKTCCRQGQGYRYLADQLLPPVYTRWFQSARSSIPINAISYLMGKKQKNEPPLPPLFRMTGSAEKPQPHLTTVHGNKCNVFQTLGFALWWKRHEAVLVLVAL